MKPTHGFFVISLDFELFWGIRDKFSFSQYGANVLGVWEVIPQLLKTFDQYNIHATFATVGAMFASDRMDLLKHLPTIQPQYSDKNLSPYNGYIENSNQNDPRYYFGKQLVERVKANKNQEIGTHTFSHYYCLEPGQDKASFLADLESSIAIAKAMDITIESFVFPRHQLNQEYINVFKDYGIKNYRGTEKMWFHSAARGEDEGIVKRAFRYADYFVWMGSHHLQDINEIENNGLNQIRASRWLRPYDSRKIFQQLKIRRIKQQMKAAAKSNKIFHLWWHPHEFGVNTKENFQMLEEILKYYSELNQKYGMQSFNFKELVAYKNMSHG